MNYEEDWLDRFKNPVYKDHIEGGCRFTLNNSSCGDQVEMMLVPTENNKINARFEGRGCVMSTISADMLCEMIEKNNLSFGDILSIDEKEWIEKFHDLSPGRYNCVLLPVRAAKEAVNGSRKI